MELEIIKSKFEEVKNLKEPKRTRGLAELMTNIEQNFDIPILKINTTEEHRNSQEFKLYIEISNERDL